MSFLESVSILHGSLRVVYRTVTEALAGREGETRVATPFYSLMTENEDKSLVQNKMLSDSVMEAMMWVTRMLEPRVGIAYCISFHDSMRMLVVLWNR